MLLQYTGIVLVQCTGIMLLQYTGIVLVQCTGIVLVQCTLEASKVRKQLIGIKFELQQALVTCTIIVLSKT